VGLETRVKRLEGRVPRPDPEAEEGQENRRLLFAVLDELSDLRATMSERSYRGSPNGLVRIEPRDLAREFYGRDYTDKEFLELATVRALAKLGRSEEEIEDLKPGLLEFFTEKGVSPLGAPRE
jgi:hypothetical protein